ncbi:MAG TPA: DPP IV N-terminal domain-containing protein [Prolixibacteraceae bacterium]|jgi:dienelactone hydrolase
MLKRISGSMFALLLIFIVPLGAFAQVTAADYQRADSIIRLNDLVYHQINNVNWIDSTSMFWYPVKTRDGMVFNLVDAAKATRKPMFDTGKLVQELNKQAGIKTTTKSIQLPKLKLDLKANLIHFEFGKFYWTCNLKNYTLLKDSAVKTQTPPTYWNDNFNEMDNKPVTSPDSIWVAFLKNYNVYIRNQKDKKEVQLSFDGSSGDFYSSYFSWSPDSKRLAVNKVRKNEDHFIYFVESSPKTQLQPILQKRNYLKPGDALPIKRPSLFNIETQKQIPVESTAFENQYSLSNLKWNDNSSAFTFEFNQRGHQAFQVVGVDGTSGVVSVIIDEQSKTFIDYSGKYFRHDLEERGEVIWASERDGWNHLYLIDLKTGKVKNQITKGNWPVREVVKVDEKKGIIFFKASEQNSDEDPYFIHYYKVNFDGSGLVDLTPVKMEHQASFSADFSYFADTYSTVNTAPITVLRRTSDGTVIMELEKADITDVLAKGWIAPEPFVAKARDGVTDIWGNIYRPSTFDPNKKYPIIEYIYAGPHSSFAQKAFRPASSAFSGLAELGFIIVQLDGMGTSNRSKAFQEVCWKNLKDAGFPDRILWIKAAAKKYSYMDTTRIGLFGGSAGGQSTLSGLLFHPEFYKAGVSSCGCHDNRMDKMWWNEQWLGYPIGPQYAECSNVVNADKLRGKLLLIVGEMDDNVDPASTMQVAAALIAAKKDFELVVLPGMNHTLGGEYGEQKRRDFFVKTFLNQSTPDWNQMIK